MLRWLCGFIAVLVTMKTLQLFGGEMTWESLWQPIVFVPVLSAANALIRPVIRFVSAPITCLTLGLFSLVINALVFWLAAWVTNIKIGFWPALGGSIIYTLLANAILNGKDLDYLKFSLFHLLYYVKGIRTWALAVGFCPSTSAKVRTLSF